MSRTILASVLLLMLAGLSPAGAATSVGLYLSDASPLYLSKIINPTISTDEIDLKVYFLAQVINEAEEVVATYESEIFELRTGTQVIYGNSVGMKDPVYESSEVGEYVENYGYFPFGKYTVCIKLLEWESGGDITDDCISYDPSLYAIPPRLDYPEDSSTIDYDWPTFYWLPASAPGVSGSDIRYRITVKEMYAEQTREEAIDDNTVFYSEENLSDLFMLYSSDITTFDTTRSYVWQVDARSVSGSSMGVSQVWIFKPEVDTFQPEVDTLPVFIIPTDRPSGTVYAADEFLYFAFRGMYTSQHLQVSIVDGLGERLGRYPSRLFLNYGDNRYALPLRKIRKLKNGVRYTLVIDDEKGDHHYVNFIKD